jgi:anaerobic sulfite reductase subunit A
MSRPDNILLENGGRRDYFYARWREKAKVILLECTTSFENCFCVSVGSNKTDKYDAAVRITPDEVLVDVRDADLAQHFSGQQTADFTPEYVTENEKKLRIPNIPDHSLIRPITNMEYWNQFDEKCIACGGCNTVCGTCSCFDTVDIIYTESSYTGERRRVWSSCMLENFTETAGGARCRKTRGANMRFKVLHKFYDYKVRFGEEHMCVGCGRCDMRCPQDISFFDTVNGLSDEIDKLNAGKEDA